MADWLRGPDLERAVAPYCKADLLRGLNRDVLLKEDASVESRCSEAFAAVKRFEESHKVAAQVLPSGNPDKAAGSHTLTPTPEGATPPLSPHPTPHPHPASFIPPIPNPVSSPFCDLDTDQHP